MLAWMSTHKTNQIYTFLSSWEIGTLRILQFDWSKCVRGFWVIAHKKEFIGLWKADIKSKTFSLGINSNQFK